MACASACGSRATRAPIRVFEPREEGGVADRAVLDHFREARGELAIGQRAQAIGVDQHGARLVERADHVLAQRMIDAGLAADGRVDLREQRRRNLHERHAALVDRRGESRDVADDAAAQRDQPVPRSARSSSRRVSTSCSVVQFLCASPSGTSTVCGAHAGCRRGFAALAAASAPATVSLVTTTAFRDGSAGKQRAGEAQGARADMDRIAALAERDLERADVRFRHGAGSRPRTGARGASPRLRSDSTTWSAVSR